MEKGDQSGMESGLLLGDWRIISTLGLIALAAAYVLSRSTLDYWKKRGFPEIAARPLPFFGHTFSLIVGRKSFWEVFDDLYKAAGDKPFAGFFKGSRACLLVKDPDLMKRILVKDFHVFMDRSMTLDEEVDPMNAKGLANLKGQRWKEMRTRLSPAFASGRMKAMFILMRACANELVDTLSKNVKENEGEAIVEMKELMTCYSTDVIATCVFGIHCDALKNPEASEFRRMGKMTFQITLKRSLMLMFFLIFPKALKWLGLRFTDDETSVFFLRFVKDMVEEREKIIKQEETSGTSEKKRFGDFIYQLVLLKQRGLHASGHKNDDNEEENEDEELEGKYNEADKTHGNADEEPSWTNVTLEDLTAQVMQFFSAGFETTSALLSFALYELTSSEHGLLIQQRLRDEIDRVTEENGGVITYEGLKKMHLLDRILNEALRLHPPGGLLNRSALQPYKIPGTNLTLNKGDEVFFPIQSMQSDEKCFKNARTFDPDRFLPERKEEWENFHFLPFGVGPRACIGQRFAQMQARLGLATLISKFQFKLCSDKTRVPIVYKKGAFLLVPNDGVWLKTNIRSM